MKYSELIQFEPIESVVQLREADTYEKARQLVQTFVISDRMAEQLCDVVFPHLQFDKPADNKGILVVGNYGTGKSHLMSLISALAEHPDLADVVKNSKVAKAAKTISAKFKVLRCEIGSTTMALRDIVCGWLEECLEKLGISFQFEPANKVRENKTGFIAMMNKFNQKYPNHGLVMFVDELLDYLKSRDDQALILDLNFLREVGEVCKLVRFRFLAGLQESLFDNPRFQHVADSVNRVRDRFEQLRIVRQDVAFVVSERLLTKNAQQKGWIREHLLRFTPLYEKMAEQIEDFVRLFPVHPAYLETFERIYIAEKREVLKTLSAEMKRLLEQEVPADQPGLVSYDSYWAHLRDNASIRTNPDVREVLDKSNVLESRIQHAFTKPAYKPVAIRICHALSVHRLTTDDIFAKIGPTAGELRDDLCLYLPIPEPNSDFLRTSVEACLKEIMKTMSGQYISRNDDNEQYYLDLKKDIDYDAKIEDRGTSLSESQLDRYYFDALIQVLECADETYVPGFRIWEHELRWQDHNVSRRGYLFFGAPNERSTAQPPRDFYLYFLQPFKPPKYQDAKLADEVFFALKKPDDDFLKALRLYAGAKQMATDASSGTKKTYADKAGEHLKSLTAWLRKNMMTAIQITHQGVPKTMIEALKNQRTGNATVGELVNLVGSKCLAPSFTERYPNYPKFSVTLTRANLQQAVDDAIRVVSGGLSTHLAKAVLDGLELLDEEKIRPHSSQYAKAVVKKLNAKPVGQVVNRKELIVQENGVEVEADFKLEPELLVIVLLALAHSGDLAVSLAGNKKLDAASLSDADHIGLEDLCKFKHIERPKDIPLSALVALFELLGLTEGLIRNPETREEAIIQLRDKSSALVKRIVLAKQQAQSGLPCWGFELIAVEDRESYRQRLDGLQTFLEKLQVFNTPGKLKNFSSDVDEVKSYEPHLTLLQDLEGLQGLVTELTPVTSYLTTAQHILPQDDPWYSDAEQGQAEWRPKLLDPNARCVPDFRQKIVQALEKLKSSYQERYLALHKKARLGASEDEKKKKLLRDPRMDRLQKLANVPLLLHGSLTELQNRLAGLKTCFSLVKDDLAARPDCQYCSFRPKDEAIGISGTIALGQIDEQVDRLTEEWTKTLLDELADPTAKESIELLDDKQKKAVKKFLKDKELPEKVSTEFVQGIHAALSGLTPIKLTVASLLEAMGDSSAPCTVEEFQTRIEEFLQTLTKGKDVSKIRIIIEKGS